MTIDPSALQAARLALATLTLTWPVLAAAADTTLTRRPIASAVRHEPAERCRAHAGDDELPAGCPGCFDAWRRHDHWADRRAQRDEQLRLEREDRDRTERYRALLSTRPPADLDVLDVRTNVLQVLHTSVLLARSDLGPWLGRRGLAVTTEPPRRVTPGTIGAASRWLADVLEHTAAAPSAIAEELQPAVRRVQALPMLGLDPDDGWHSLGTARCPGCRQRALYRWTASPDRRAWTRECRALLAVDPARPPRPCLCAGAGCPCGRPGARPGSRHLWPTT